MRCIEISEVSPISCGMDGLYISIGEEEHRVKEEVSIFSFINSFVNDDDLKIAYNELLHILWLLEIEIYSFSNNNQKEVVYVFYKYKNFYFYFCNNSNTMEFCYVEDLKSLIK